MTIIGNYRGRFAPSPSGHLHLGSLMCALASYLDARSHRGKWLLRIDDIDPPREVNGAAESIIKSLQAHGFKWDEPIRFQSKSSVRYREALHDLHSQQLTYRCECNRKRLKELSGGYDGCCRQKQIDSNRPSSVRLNLEKALSLLGAASDNIAFTDTIQGQQNERLMEQGDFIIHRKDGLFAYQLAVVAEDVDQQISHIVRGTDLLDTTGKHIFLTRLFGKQPKNFAHIPILLDNTGKKLSKQNHAPPIDDANPRQNLFKSLQYLAQNPPTELQSKTVDTIMAWAIEHWHTKALKKQEQVYEH